MPLSARAQKMARFMVFEGMTAVDAYKTAGYQVTKHITGNASKVQHKPAFEAYVLNLQNTITESMLDKVVMTYDELLAAVQEIIQDETTSTRDKLTALKLLGSAKTITAWKEVHEVKVNAHESFVLTGKVPGGQA